MSDYISNNEKYSIFYKSIYGNDNYSSDASYSGLLNNDLGLCDKEVGFTTVVNTLDHRETSRSHQEGDIFGQNSTLSDGSSLSESIDISYVGELQRLSSKLIQLLTGARQRSLKVKASCGVSERPQLEQGGSGSRDCRPAGRHLASQLRTSFETGIPGHADILVEHVDNVPVGSKSTGTTTSDGKASRGVSQRPQLEQKGKDQGGSGPFRNRLAGRQLATPLGSSFETGIPGHGNILEEHVNNVPLRSKSAGRKISNNDAPRNGVFPRFAKTSMTDEVPMNGFSAECLVTPREDTHKEKERQKKEIHNKIEKRRRWLINEKITELGNLLPDNINRASGLKKGSILKETVEYIKQLRKDQGRVHRLEKKMGETCLEVKQLAQRLEQWEIRMATKGANSGGTGHLQDETYENRDINNSLTVEPAKTREYPFPILQDTPLDMLTTESEMMDLAQVWDDVSSKFSADSTISLPLIAGVDINDMDCYF